MMIKLYKNEIRWLMNFVQKSKIESESCMIDVNNKYRALHKLEYENMDTLYKKLETALNKGDKRIEIV